MEKLLVKTEQFEGPMDLLLHLVAVHKLSILDINIFELVEQYLDYIKQMEKEDLEVTSDFLDMAARLIYIKTVSLLPRQEEAQALKKELIGELIEYRDCRTAASMLRNESGGFNNLVREPMNIPTDKNYTRSYDAIELCISYINAAGKRIRKLPVKLDSFKEIVQKKVISVHDKISQIKSMLLQTGEIKLLDLYKSASTRSDLVASFLAVLEMAKSGAVLLSDSDEIQIKLANKTKTGES